MSDTAIITVRLRLERNEERWWVDHVGTTIGHVYSTANIVSVTREPAMTVRVGDWVRRRDKTLPGLTLGYA